MTFTKSNPAGESGAVGSDKGIVRGNEQDNPNTNANAPAPEKVTPPAAHLRLISSAPSVSQTDLAVHQIKVTFFDDVRSTKHKQVVSGTLPMLRGIIHKPIRDIKKELPLLKLAGFGDKLNDEGSLRWNDNVNSIEGIELDYDKEKISFEEAVAILERERLRTLIYTSPSHTPSAPRWRLLLPLSKTEPDVGMHPRLVARINGLFGNIFASESFTLSQSYFYGQSKDNPDRKPQALVIDGDFVDLRSDLERFESVGMKDDAAHTKHKDDAGHAKPNEDDQAKDDQAKDDDEASLPAELLKLVKEGVPIGKRSEKFHHAVGWLKDLRWSEEAILDLLKRYPTGIADKYVKANTLKKEVHRSYSKTADPPPTPPQRVDAPIFSDEYLALHFANEHAHRLRYVAKWNKWVQWDGVRWQLDEDLSIFSLARKLCRTIAKTCNNPRDARKIASAKTVAAVVSLVRSDRRIAARVDQWDNDPWLLNTPGGVVDLRTGQMRDHRPEDYLTKCTSVTPGGECPRYDQFMVEVTGGNVEMQRYINRVDGLSLTGDTSEQVFFFHHGEGQNGKGTKQRVVAGILNDYYQSAAFETFTANDHPRHETELAMLRGARVVLVSETEDGKSWAEAKIKQVTGDDPISARFMRQDFFTYRPQFKLHISGQHRPNFKTVDKAIRRRLRLIPYDVIIPDDKRDNDLSNKLKAEWPGILAKMIQGCLEWQKDGLQVPEKARLATERYLDTEDKIGNWISECIDTSDVNHYASSTELFRSWTRWTLINGEWTGSLKNLVKKLQDRGHKHDRSPDRKSNGFFGMKVQPIADDDDVPFNEDPFTHAAYTHIRGRYGR
jgi:putative DNA primase/helicase